jgi:hypothetical protein
MILKFNLVMQTPIVTAMKAPANPKIATKAPANQKASPQSKPKRTPMTASIMPRIAMPMRLT